jgi:hypothetical protein
MRVDRKCRDAILVQSTSFGWVIYYAYYIYAHALPTGYPQCKCVRSTQVECAGLLYYENS